jgi:hypothetical protein
VLPLGGLHVKRAVQRGIWVNNLVFAPGPRNITANIDRVGRSEGLPDVN